MKALDLEGQLGIELVRQEWDRCKWKVVTETDPETHEKDRWLEPVEVDANGDKVYESSSTSKWTVQKGTWGKQGGYKGTSPVRGSTCVRSAIGTTCELVNDDQMARLVFKVNSGGTLTYSCLTACDSSDGVIVYVDGQEEKRHFDGYGTDVIWGDDPENPGNINGEYSITVDGGLAPEGSAYAGTYAHEIVFEFCKDEPSYYTDEKGNLKSLEEPDEPQKQDYYYGEGEFDKESFDLDMAEYYSFRNSVWLDGFQWTPEPLELSIGTAAAGEKLSLIDQGGVLLFNNALDYGYSVRYTLDGSEPTTTSPLYQQSIGSEEAVLIDHSCTITAMIFTDKDQPVKETLTRREVVVKASAPTFKAEMGPAGTVQVTMSSAFAGNAIHYTLNGTTPTASSDTYGGNALVLNHAVTIKAMCTRAGVEDSDVADYVIPVSQPPKEMVVTDLAGRKEPTQVYANDDGLLVSCVRIPGASLLYSIDGGAWKAYQGPVRVLVQNGATKAVIAFSSQEPGKFPSSSISTTIYKANVNCTIKGEGEPSENSLVFKDGWTLFGPPVTLSSGDAQSFLNMFDFFTYDVQGKSYVKASIFEEGQAYWVFLRPGELMGNISFTGAFKDDFSLSSLTKGWHGYGANKNGSVPAHVVAWKFQNGRFELTNTFKRGEGYFIYKD